ncbi:MAG: NTP transferase domain-containing protein [Nitrospinales bacterium]
MKAIILAAGEGSRLRPLTNSKPKCLVELAGKPLLDWQIDALRRCGVRDIVVVRGYRADRIERADVRFYDNPSYATTNMVASLWRAAGEFTEDIVVSYADIVYAGEVLAALINCPKDIAVVVDRKWKPYWEERFEDPLSDAESLKIDSQGNITSIGQKPDALSEIEGQYIGLMKFTKGGLKLIQESYDNAISGEKAWGQSKPVERAYMTDLLQGLILEGIPVRAVEVSGGWLEIDSLSDYELAKKYIVDGAIRRG